MRTSRIAVMLLLTTCPVALQAQSSPGAGPVTGPATRPARQPAAPTQAADDEGDGDIVVRGARPPGAVIGDIPPDQQLTPANIRSYGVSSVADLLAELAPQTRSGRGGGGAPVRSGIAGSSTA